MPALSSLKWRICAPGLTAGAAPPRARGDTPSSGLAGCSRRGWPAEPVAHPAARRGERDPERIADDGQEQGGSWWQDGRRRSRLVSVLDTGWPLAGGDAAHLPHHVPVYWLPG